MHFCVPYVRRDNIYILSVQHVFPLQVHVRTRIMRREYNSRSKFIQQHHQRGRLSAAAAASATATLMYSVVDWLGGRVGYW